MKLYAVKRVIEMNNGGLDESLVPVFPKDVLNLKKIPENKPVEITLKQKRDTVTNSKLWALCEYFVNNLPEYYYRKDDITGELVPCFSSKDQLYKWLAHRIGWVEVISVPGQEPIQFVKSTSFENLEDETIYKEEFHDPAVEELARMSDMTIGQLMHASLEWKNEKIKRKPW